MLEDKFKKLQKANLIFAAIYSITFFLQIVGEIRHLLHYGEYLSGASSSFYVVFLGCILIDLILLYFVSVFYKRSKVGVPEGRDEQQVFLARSRAFRSMVITTVVVLMLSMPMKFVARGIMDAIIFPAATR